MVMAAPFSPEQFGQYLLLSHLGRGGMADVYKARVEGVSRLLAPRGGQAHPQGPHRGAALRRDVHQRGEDRRRGCRTPTSSRSTSWARSTASLHGHGVRPRPGPAAPCCAPRLHGRAGPPPQVALIVREICEGARLRARAHRRERRRRSPIIHRDVSPQNVMIGYDGQVKLVDFGIAKAVTAHTRAPTPASLKGKFGYMAPEQIDTGTCDRADRHLLRRRGAARGADRAAAVQGADRLRHA